MSNLTIDSDITIRGKVGQVGNSNASTTHTNRGTIHSDEPGRITIEGGGGWSNEGTISASNGGDLRFLRTWTNEPGATIG